MTEVHLSARESRIVGSMIEKAMTTPDNYPMSLNGVLVACNQVSNRDPVVEYTEADVERTLRDLADRGLAKMVHRPGDRVVKYRHALDESVGLADRSLALVAVLLLRGAQTPGELRQRTVRYVEFESLESVEAELERLRERSLVRRIERQPGQKEHRYEELLSEGGDGSERAESLAIVSEIAVPPIGDHEANEIEALKGELAALRHMVERVYEELGLE